MTHQVINNQKQVKFQGTEAQCRNWVRHYNAGFFCKVEAIVSKTPLEHQLRECLADIESKEAPKTPTTMGMPASVWSVIPIC